jgi:hypothetical protein
MLIKFRSFCGSAISTFGTMTLSLAVQFWVPMPAACAKDQEARRENIEAQCPLPVGEWRCFSFGTIELRADGASFRLTQFSNADSLAEIEKKDHIRRLLTRKATGSELYFGLPDSELVFSRNPFRFFAEGFAAPLMALHLGFPGGPSSLSSEPATRNVVLWGTPAAITAWSLPDKRVGYRLDGMGHAFEGEYGTKHPEPLSDGDIAAWGAPQHVQNLPLQPSPNRPIAAS